MQIEKNIVNDFKLILKKNKKKSHYSNFFKKNKNPYEKNDLFIGISIPDIKKLIPKYNTCSLDEIKYLLNNQYHEVKLFAIFLLVNLYEKDLEKKEKIFLFYIKNARKINNWDLVDSSAYKIIGNFLLKNQKKKYILYEFVKSDSLWKRRIAIISTFSFIKNNQFEDSLKISKILLNDKQDLIHKAVGWMLREIGKRDKNSLEYFLKNNINKIPRTTLRYAIEKFDNNLRKYYLKL